MKRILSVVLFSLVAMASMVSLSEVISQEMAKQTAERLLSNDSEWQVSGDADITLVEKDGVPAYYIVEYEQGGWVIVAAQSSARPLIAYNHTGEYSAPEPMQMVLDTYRDNVVEEAATPTATRHMEWSGNIQRMPAADPAATPDVAPLITVDFDQGDPYNKYCPSEGGQKTVVGCVAVGMAQAMMVARYPDRPTGKYSYNCDGIGRLSIDYDAEDEYDWDAMYGGDYDKIARLLYHCGVSVNMDYGVDGSGTQTTLVADALVRNFKYDGSRVRFVDRPEDDNEWLSILLDEIYLGRAVVYRGQAPEGGHCWNLDGWKNSTQMVHVNWGWGGSGNGYYDINSMRDSYQNMSFPDMHGAVVGVGAPTTAPYSIKLSNNKFAKGTAAGVALADVIVSCEDAEAVLEYELLGPKNITGKNVVSPYEVRDGKLVSTVAVEESKKFQYLLIKVTNANTGESYEREFDIRIVENSSVEGLMSDNMRLYPAVARDYVVLEVPVAGGEYAIYTLSGAQVATGKLANLKNEISVEQLPAGAYIVRYEHSDVTGMKRFIKR